MQCRCAVGLESPETARCFLNYGKYPVIAPVDAWEIGLLLIDLTESSRPEDHHRILMSKEFIQAMTDGVQDPRQSVGQMANLEYLSGLREGAKKPGFCNTAYADQVCHKRYLQDMQIRQSANVSDDRVSLT